MPQEKIIIKFAPQGDKQLIAAIKKLNVETKKLTGTVVGTTVSNKGLAKSQHLVDQRMSNNVKSGKMLQSTFATLRNKLLLLSFATAMAVKPLLDLVNAFSMAEEIGNKFNVVFGRQADIVREWASVLGKNVGRAQHQLEGMLATLQDTFVPLGFARVEATKLSTSLVTLSLDVASFNNKLDEEVIRDFQSALVGNHETVRKYGIVITEATLKQEAMRSGIIKNDRELTNQEKVQARLNIIYAQSKDAIGDLERTQDSYANTLKRFNSQLDDTKVALGETLLPVATALLEIGGHFADEATIKGYATAVTTVGAAMLTLKIRTIGATAALTTFKLAIAKTGLGLLVVGLGELATRLIFTEGEASGTANTFDGLTNSINNANSSVEVSTELTEKQRASLLASTEAHNKLTLSAANLMHVRIGVSETDQQLLAIQSRKLQLNELEEQGLIDIISRNTQLNALEVKSLKLKEQQQFKLSQMKKKTVAEGLRSSATLASINSKNMKHAARLQAAAGMIDAFAAAQSQFASVSKVAPPPFPQIAYIAALAQGIAQAQQITKSAGTGIFETGGLIGGRRHSQGGTTIEAEEGEFIMSRSAVESVGIENLNRMNEGGGSSNVTVNVSGNVMSQDYVEGELAEQIKEAIRRGNDFGIS